MSLNNSAKIFIDVDDEINFVVEKVLNSESDRVILVVPQNAIIVSSLVSMKILAKQLVKSKKLAVLVTEDKFGLQIAAQSGITAANKVSSITPEMWEAAQIAKEKTKTKIKELKNDLLANRGIVTNQAVEPGDIVEDLSEETGKIDVEPKAEETEPVAEDVEELAEEPNEPEPVVEEMESEQDNLAKSEDDIIETEEPEKKEEESEAEVQGAIQRPRREAKIVELSGFKIYAGGDISTMRSVDTQDNLDADDSASDSESEGRQVGEAKLKGGFTGRDWTRYTASSGAGSGFSLAKLWPFKSKASNREPGDISPKADNPDEQKRKRKMLIIALVVALVVILGAGYLFAFQFSTVDLRITLKTAEVPINQQLSADTAMTTIDETKLILPAKEITEEDLSISASDNTTGSGQKGKVATGVIDIWNKCLQTQQVLKAGTVLTNESTNLNYKLKQDVTIEGVKKPCGDPSNTVVQVQDVPVEAEKFGTNYNITDLGTGQQVNFKIAGYNATDMEAKRFKNIDGGTTESFQATAQADVDRVKGPLVDRLKEQGTKKLEALVPTGYRLIEGSQVFTETKTSASPAVGEEGTSFSLSVEGKMTALIIAESDLEKGINLVVKNKQELDANFEIDGLGDTVITNVKRDGQKVSFAVTSKGSIQSKVTESEIKDALVGKSMDEANDYLVNVKEIDSFKLTFFPGIVPESLRRIPSADRIKISFK